MTATDASQVSIILELIGLYLWIGTHELCQANPSCVLQTGGSTFYYETREIPTLQSDRDVIVRVVATGLCGSDVCIPFSTNWIESIELNELIEY